MVVLFTALRQCQQEVARFLEALACIDPHEVSNSDAARLPTLSSTHPLCQQGARLGEAIRQLCQRLHELEHARTAAEVRCRRAVAEAEQIRAIFANFSDPLFAVDEYNELVLANPIATQLLELPSGDTAERAISQVVRCQKLVELLAATTRCKTPAARSEELEIIDAAGRARWYRATAIKLGANGAGTAAEGNARGAVVVLRDVGELKALQKRNAEFVSAVSHEMKTPLAGIKAYVELLADGDAEDEATREEFLQIINGQAERLQRLIDNLLNLARIEAGVVQVHKEPRSLNELLEEALRVVRPAAEAKNITLTAELSSLYLGVLADRDMLLQAAINLLSNAIKYTHSGGRVTLRSRLVGNEVRFEVQDTGVGLSEEDCRRVFEKFYRVKKDAGMASGTGLGLPLVKHIIEDVHGGRVFVESKPGVGSTFTAVLSATTQLAADPV
jgi:two-component system phosphate regulon sensor histidine kinase PhoR